MLLRSCPITLSVADQEWRQPVRDDCQGALCSLIELQNVLNKLISSELLSTHTLEIFLMIRFISNYVSTCLSKLITFAGYIGQVELPL